MILAADRLEAQIAGGLSPIYLISGDEPLLTAEAADLVRARARAMDYSERTVLTVDRGFDWGELAAAAGAMSLFAEKRLIELRIPTGKPGVSGAKALASFAESPPEDTVLLVLTPRLDKRVLKSAWAKALDAAGIMVQVWPPDRSRLPGWISGRMKSMGLQPEAGVAELIADRVEGNLLAADQEIRKLALLLGTGSAGQEDVARAVSDCARYDVFDLVDALSKGDFDRGHRMLSGLKGEGVEPTLVLWAIVRELRALAAVTWAMSQGRDERQAMTASGIWARRQPGARAAIHRHGREGLLRLIGQAASVDRVIKGSTPGRPWQVLADLVTAVASGSNDVRRGAA
ncbi:MAG: DNA polymerase III subunit delta [Gammaproteobacteria bacterium]|nr:MAG: DNA polymerase III subunit delta [Gammaproteobacteria bacterium]